MSELLIIRLGHDAVAEASWAPADAVGRLLGTTQHGTLSAAAGMARDRRVVALVPAEQLMLTEVSVPGLRGPRLRQAIPFALEDRLATDVDEIHCAIGAMTGDGLHQVAVVEHRVMQAWLDAFREAGLSVAAIVPDCLALPWGGDGEVTVAITPDRVLVRDGEARGFACERALLEPMLAGRANGMPATRVGIVDTTPVPSVLAGTPVTTLHDGLLAWLAPQAIAPPLDLLQGRYAPRQRRAAALGRWRLPAALAAVWVVLVVGTWLLEYRAVAAEHARLQAEIGEIFSSVIADEPMVDPRLQIERRLGGGVADAELLRLLATVADGAAQVDGIEITGLTYRPGQLDVAVAARTVGGLDQLRDRVLAAGRVDAVIDSASSQGDEVEGRLQVRGGAR
ncbi:MAG: type II secretion system protein GspL [Gammaproteobacteria bacterium]